jgi:hypothetical protein
MSSTNKKWIIYSDGDEVIITDKKREQETLNQYFVQGGRVLADYERREIQDCALELNSGIELR